MQTTDYSTGMIGPFPMLDNLVLHLDAANTRSYPRGNTWYDLSANGYSGSFINGPIFDQANSGGIYFDGTDDYIQMGNMLDGISFTNGLTVEAWVKPTATKYYARIFDFSNGPNTDNLILGQRFSDRVWFYETKNYGSGGDVYEGVQFQLNVPQQICITLNPASAGTISTSKIYLNSSLRFSVGNARIPITSNRTISYIGKSTYTALPDEYYQGYIYVIKIYNTTFNATQIKRNYDSLKLRFGLT